MNNQIILEVTCPYCHHSLMTEEVKIKGLASVHLNIRSEENKKGNIYLCSAYECFAHQKDIPIKEREIVGLCCPHCHQELLTQETCQVCGAPMAELGLAGGGFIRICSRKGCFNHFLSKTTEQMTEH
jgi:RNA polymerase subunit RPABC4/transcription elongation factor Spt4